MPLPDFEGLGRLLAQRSREILPLWFPEGGMAGHEFKVGNLQGDPGASLSINCNTGRWADFEADKRGGDLISLFAAKEGIDQGEAFKRLSNEEGFDASQPPPPIKPAPEIKIITPPPPNAERPSFGLKNFGAASAWWVYESPEGAPLFYISRHDPPWPKGAKFQDNKIPTKKQLFPWSWNQQKGKFTMVGYTKPRPLYGLPLLEMASPEKWALIVEGEKSADAARKLAPADIYVVMTWCGGGSGVEFTNFGPLRGRRCLLWPDADRHIFKGELLAPEFQPGMATMLRVAAKLQGIASEVRIIHVDHDGSRLDGWDAANALEDGWTWPQVKSWANPLTRPYEPPREPARAAEERIDLIVGGRSTPEPGKPDLDEGPPVFSEEEIARDCSNKWAHSLRFCNEWGLWLRWTSGAWRRDVSLETFEEVRNVCARRARIFANFLEDNEKSIGPARAIASLHCAKAVDQLIKSDHRQRSKSEQYDADAFLLGTPGGTVDLRTGELREARQVDYITKQAGVTPKAGPFPVWDAFLASATGGDSDMESYLKRMAGYCLTGTAREQVAFFLYGPAATGKSTFVETIFSLMGEYATASQIELLTPRGSEHPTLIAKLIGVRMVALPETEEGRAIAESRFKGLVDGSAQDARFMREDYFKFRPVCKLVIHGNHRPSLKSIGEEIRRRLRVIPFEEVVEERDRDPLLKEKLFEEGPAILAWMIEGCVEWQREGLRPPEVVRAASSDYFESEDIVARFLDECAEVAPHYSTTRAIIWARWERWAKAQGEHPRSNRWLIANLRRSGILTESRVGNKRGFRGLSITDDVGSYGDGYREKPW